MDKYKNMCNLIDYIDWRGDLSFEQHSFSPIDALVLCQISYLNFDTLIESNNFDTRISLSELGKIYFNAKDFKKRSDLGLLINKQTVDLFQKVSKSERFCKIKVTGYNSIIDLEKEEQFCGITFILDRNNAFVAYRGTDDTIVGWKEDFNLGFMEEVPAQKDAVLYLKKALILPYKVMVGGHSKGGNLAIYASSKVTLKEKNKITKVYNFDGPGFTEEKLKSIAFMDILPKLDSYFPHFSIVGMLFNHEGNYRIVRSEEKGIMQHDPMSWHIMGQSFIFEKDLDKGAKIFHTTFNSWLLQMTKEQRSKFIEALFTIIRSTKAQTNREISNDILQNSVKIITCINNLDDETKDLLDKTIKLFIRTAGQQFPSIEEIKQQSLLQGEEKIKKFINILKR